MNYTWIIYVQRARTNGSIGARCVCSLQRKCSRRVCTIQKFIEKGWRHDEWRQIQTLDLFIPKTQTPNWAQTPQTSNLQTLWSLKYSTGSVLNNQRLLVACVYTAKWSDCDCNCEYLVLFGRSSWIPSVWWIIIVRCQQTSASLQSVVSFEPRRLPSWLHVALKCPCCGTKAEGHFTGRGDFSVLTCHLLLCLMCCFYLLCP